MNSQKRVIIESISTEIEGGLYAAKAVIGKLFPVEADIYADGNYVLNAELLFRHESQKKWQKVSFKPLSNDRWHVAFRVEKQGYYFYKIQASINHALSWQMQIDRKIKDNQKVHVELSDGIPYLKFIKEKCNKSETRKIVEWIAIFEDKKQYSLAVQEVQSTSLKEMLNKYSPRTNVSEYDKNLQVYVDRQKAFFSSWYGIFPRSTSKTEGTHGTFKDCERLLPRIADMGFDTLYFPPIHPIGKDNRRGKNGTFPAKPGDVGSPWSIGGQEGGHKAIHPELGILKDFKELLKTAENYGIEIALDLAFQCSPNHPYIKKYPQWFTWKSDGTLQCAENTSWKTPDIIPFNFETEDLENLQEELLSIIFYWIEQGVNIFRIDKPHEKPFLFWEWIIKRVKKKYPDIIFLAGSVTRPKLMN